MVHGRLVGESRAGGGSDAATGWAGAGCDADLGWKRRLAQNRRRHCRFSAPVEMRKPAAPRRLIVWPPSYFFNAPKTCWSVAVVRATGFCLICRSSAATILNSPSIALFVT